MIGEALRVIGLAIRLCSAYPAVDPAEAITVAAVAVRAETPAAPAELLLAIAEHESGFASRTVSSIERGRRVDRTVGKLWASPTWPATCGLVQTVALDRAACERLLVPANAFAAGAAEIEAWMRACRGDRRCGLAGYAGGWAGARAARSGEVTVATRFADLFLARARRLSSPHLRARAHWTWSARLVSIGGHTWG